MPKDERKKRLKLVLSESAVGALFGLFVGALFFEAFFGRCATIIGGFSGAVTAAIYTYVFKG